jgi:hypothetical protein
MDHLEVNIIKILKLSLKQYPICPYFGPFIIVSSSFFWCFKNLPNLKQNSQTLDELRTNFNFKIYKGPKGYPNCVSRLWVYKSCRCIRFGFEGLFFEGFAFKVCTLGIIF